LPVCSKRAIVPLQAPVVNPTGGYLLIDEPDNWSSWEAFKPTLLIFSGEDSLASNKAGAYLL
jgi:hypothetical protein